MLLWKVTKGHGDEGMACIGDVQDVVVYFHFRVYNNGEEDGNTHTFRKCHRGD